LITFNLRQENGERPHHFAHSGIGLPLAIVQVEEDAHARADDLDEQVAA
jgi:hypothetical protein